MSHFYEIRRNENEYGHESFDLIEKQTGRVIVGGFQTPLALFRELEEMMKSSLVNPKEGAW